MKIIKRFSPLVLLAIFALNTWAADDFKFKNLSSVPVEASACSVILMPRPAKLVSLVDEKNIIITAWNPENVMELKGHHSYVGVNEAKQTYRYERAPEKDRQLPDWKFSAKQNKILNVGKYLGLEEAPLSHFIISPEVENLNAAQRLFNSAALAKRYNTFLIEGNDERGIDIALAIRSDLDVKVESETHKNVMWSDTVETRDIRLFSRDLPAWIIKDGKTGKVLLIIFGNHAKSKRDRAGGRDHESSILRTAQYVGAAQIISGYQKRFGANVPMIMAGDFNTDVRYDKEVEAIKTVLQDSFDIAGVKDRITQTFHPRDGDTVQSQLDAIFVNAIMARHIRQAMVLPEFDRVTGEKLGQPDSYEERNERYPSDHRAISIVLDGDLL